MAAIRPPACCVIAIPDRGEIRAIGDVLQDQLFYMKRCGIHAFALREDKDIEAALAGLSVFSENSTRPRLTSQAAFPRLVVLGEG